MNVELPQTGCNILIKNDTFQNITSTERQTWVIYDGVAHLSEVESGSFTTTGTCLNTGDLVYKPELEVYFKGASCVVCAFIFWLVYHITIERLIK